jgi:hypothetical protein
LGKKIFVSYSHAQGEWVRGRLVPCLKAGGAEVLIDCERFVAGKPLIGQIDASQDAAHMHLLILSPDYLKSENCSHELRRAVTYDPNFDKGMVLPVQRVKCELPPEIAVANPLYVNLVDDNDAAAWKHLVTACDAYLGVPVPEWLLARDELTRLIERNQSVNLVVSGKPKWRELIYHLGERLGDLALVNLDMGSAASRSGLIEQIVRALGSRNSVPGAPHDLGELDRVIKARPLSRLALLNFDHVNHRYDDRIDLFSALRFLIMDVRKLVLLAQSKTPFAALLPRNHPFSQIDLKTVELKGEDRDANSSR